MFVLRIFLFIYVWAQIETDYDLILCVILIFLKVTSSGHALLKSRVHRAKMWINESSERVRVIYLIQIELKVLKGN